MIVITARMRLFLVGIVVSRWRVWAERLQLFVAQQYIHQRLDVVEVDHTVVIVVGIGPMTIQDGIKQFGNVSNGDSPVERHVALRVAVVLFACSTRAHAVFIVLMARDGISQIGRGLVADKDIVSTAALVHVLFDDGVAGIGQLRLGRGLFLVSGDSDVADEVGGSHDCSKEQGEEQYEVLCSHNVLFRW